MNKAAITLYGIPNCDQVKKARAWLTAQQIDYCFHDFKRDGISAALVEHWFQSHGWESLVNKRGTTWRALSIEQQAIDQSSALALMLAQPSVIKRPVLDTGKHIKIGFSETDYQAMFSDVI